MKYPLLYPTLIALALGNFSHTHAAGLPTLQEVTVSSGAQDLTGIADSASEGTVTAKQLATRSRTAHVKSALQALNILYVLVATGTARLDDRFHDRELHFNIHAR